MSRQGPHHPALTLPACRSYPWHCYRVAKRLFMKSSRGPKGQTMATSLLAGVLCGVKSVHYNQLALAPWVILQDRLFVRRAVRFIEKNDYLFCGSWLPYLFSHNTPPPRSLWDLLRDSFLPFIYLSLLNIEILQTHRQESGVWSLCLMVEIVKSSTKFWQISLYYLRLEWLLP